MYVSYVMLSTMGQFRDAATGHVHEYVMTSVHHMCAFITFCVIVNGQVCLITTGPMNEETAYYRLFRGRATIPYSSIIALLYNCHTYIV